ncbi:MAG: endolytic transglycosylase MltG [Acidimicrobiia bacterium]
MTDEPTGAVPTLADADRGADAIDPGDVWSATDPAASARRGAVPERTAARDDRRRRRRRTLVVLLVVAGLVLLPLLVVGGWFVWQLDPPGSPGDPVSVEIQPGWGAREAGDALSARGVIGSALAFQVWARLQGTTFQAGTYDLRADMGVRAAADALEAGPARAVSNQVKLLVPPGLTLDQIADRVGALPGHSRDAFLAVAGSGAVRSKYQPAGVTSLEGLTWPDTYFVGEHETDEEILRVLVNAFDEHADAAGLGTPNPSGLSPYETIVSASLIQGEAGGADQPIVAGVIVNRLRRGMPLQIDSTLCYVKHGCPPAPNNADKQIDSPYNTYRVVGLPPTPILTVTESALRAAQTPVSHDYLYYVTGTDGVTRYATTLAGHEENIRAHGVRGE